ncbi:MAG: CDP-diacylglycerol--glycerol-3-phosphate 3-phosphatidyltransferase [Actinomycetota bacterium]
MNAANAITIMRVALVPVFVFLAYQGSRSAAVASLVAFGVASVSDWVDGYIARRRRTVSAFGEFMDPLADKLLVGAALYVLVDARDFPLWAALVIGAREIVVQVLRIRIVQRGGALPASPAAKAKTVTQIIMVSWWLLPWDAISPVHHLLIGVVLITTLWSGFDYVRGYLRVVEPAS